MFKKPLWQTVWTKIRLLIGAVCSGSTLFASILNLSVMLENYLQQTTSADDIFRCIFFLGALRDNYVFLNYFRFQKENRLCDQATIKRDLDPKGKFKSF